MVPMKTRAIIIYISLHIVERYYIFPRNQEWNLIKRNIKRAKIILKYGTSECTKLDITGENSR